MSQTSSNPDRPKWEVYPHLYFSKPSVEVSAVVWILETSTDPMVVTAAAELAVDLQWPLDRDLASARRCLQEIFDSCFDFKSMDNKFVAKLRGNMAHRAINCGRAFCSLSNIVRASGQNVGPDLYWYDFALFEHDEHIDPQCWTQLFTKTVTIDDYGDLMSSDKWAFHTFASLPHIILGQKGPEYFLDTLHVDKIAGLDESAFADYLCCINSFLGHMDPRILVEVDKSRLRLPLMVQLFKALRRPNMDISLAAKIISTTAHLMNKYGASARTRWMDIEDLMTEISQFCRTFPPGHESLQVLVSAATLARDENPQHFEDIEIKGQNVEWIFSSLEYVQQLWEESPKVPRDVKEWDSTTTLSVRSLLQFLAFSASDSISLQPPLKSLHIILRALSAPGDTSQMATQVLYRAPRNWFLDPTSKSLMQDNSVWSQLGHVTLKYLYRIDLEHYLSLGEDIAKTAEWKLIIYEDLSTWITAFMIDTDRYHNLNSAKFVSVIQSVWIPELLSQIQLLNERNESWILALMALANVWKTFQFNPVSALACLRLARCTITTSLRVQYFYREHDCTQKPIPSDIRAAFSSQLGEALIQAAANARKTLIGSSPPPLGDMGEEESQNITPTFERIAALLDVLGGKVSTEFEPTSGEVQLGGATKRYRDWEELQKNFEAELDALEELVST
ncbi:hypothetical protein B0H13DRAFT_1866474 [Mycena leptocephala]|nr:hypothetical protein B0H13DRAFT_1866474 [Mycena leptocephala]